MTRNQAAAWLRVVVLMDCAQYDMRRHQIHMLPEHEAYQERWWREYE